MLRTMETSFHKWEKMVVTGLDSTPIQVCNPRVTQSVFLHTTHEEADVIIAQQVVYLAEAGANTIRVVSDDTDVFLLLIYFYSIEKLTCNVFMSATLNKRASIKINACARKYLSITPHLF